jgi:hypothetical protein
MQSSRSLHSTQRFALYQGTTYRLRKTLFFEGYGLQPVHKRLKTGTALAAEGGISIRLRLFPAASLVVPSKRKKSWALQAAEKLCSLKGTGFSPYIND